MPRKKKELDYDASGNKINSLSKKEKKTINN